MLVKTINKIRVSIPDWPGWEELDRWDKLIPPEDRWDK